MGVCDPVVDALVAEVLKAHDRPHLIAATRALDRVLLYGQYTSCRTGIQRGPAHRLLEPLRHARSRRSAPAPTSATWWIDPAKAAITDAARTHGP